MSGLIKTLEGLKQKEEQRKALSEEIEEIQSNLRSAEIEEDNEDYTNIQDIEVKDDEVLIFSDKANGELESYMLTLDETIDMLIRKTIKKGEC